MLIRTITFVVLALAATHGEAQKESAGGATGFPSKPVRIVVPYAPGGGLDILARLLAARLNEKWGQPVVVDNRPGASGMVGTQIVAKAPPDGYTMVVVAAEHVMAPQVFKRSLYDPVKDFAPITQTIAQSYLLVVNPSVPASTVREFITHAKERAAPLNFSSSGTGGVGHLSGELFKIMAGIPMQHIAYKGTGPAITETIGGQIQAMFANPLPVMPHVRSGRLRLIASTSEKRAPALPDTPTIGETIPGFATSGWSGVLAPAGTPKPIVETLNRAVAAIMHLPDIRERYVSDGGVPVGSSPEAFAKLIVADQARWGKIISEARVSAE